jgi:hypothetical protein
MCLPLTLLPSPPLQALLTAPHVILADSPGKLAYNLVSSSPGYFLDELLPL